MDYSLPYIDEKVHPDYEEYALALIEEEMKQISLRPLDRDMPTLNCRTSVMQQEYTTLIQKGENDDGEEEEGTFVPRTITIADIDTTKPPNKPNNSKDMTSIQEWKDQSLSYARSKYEAERIRGTILDVEKQITSSDPKKGTVGIHPWKNYNDTTLSSLQQYWSKQVTKQTEQVDEINFQRQQSQERNYGPQLNDYQSQYQQSLYQRNQYEYSTWLLQQQQQQSQQEGELQEQQQAQQQQGELQEQQAPQE